MSLSSKLSITDVDLNGKRVLIRVCLLLNLESLPKLDLGMDRSIRLTD